MVEYNFLHLSLYLIIFELRSEKIFITKINKIRFYCQIKSTYYQKIVPTQFVIFLFLIKKGNSHIALLKFFFFSSTLYVINLKHNN